MRGNGKKLSVKLLALLLSAVLLSAIAPCAWAQDAAAEPTATPVPEGSAAPESSATSAPESSATPAPEESAAPEESILDADALTKLVESFLGERGISTKGFALGFCYTATGDSWYFNGDKWFYPASAYKVPLMMLLSEKVKSGEITQETGIKCDELGETRPVSEIEDLVLVNSSNPWAHAIRKYLGGDEVWRKDAMGYASLAESEYDPDYMQYCYFSTRFLNEVVETLYNESERFPNIIETMKLAEPTHYFRLSMEGVYDVAQKYGSYTDQQGSDWNSTTGIIYTPNPIIVTVMTVNVAGAETVISDAAVMMKNYALELDKKLSGYQRSQEAAREEEARQQREQELQEQQRQADAERAKQEQEAAAKAIAEQQTLQEARKQLFTRLIILAAVVAVLVAGTLMIIKTKRRKEREARYESYRRRYEAEARSREQPRSNGRSGGRHDPRH